MAKLDRSLAIDIGSTAVRVSEFEFPANGGLILHGFQQADYVDQVSEANRTDVITKALAEALEEGNFSTRKASVCVSGQAAFLRFVNLPPVSEEESRIKQIVEYEAKQNVPFPMDGVIWDYQLLAGAEEGPEVMFVVIKNDIVESIIDAVGNAGLSIHIVDFAPSVLYNAARANHIGNNGCDMVLNIGGRCTTLLFLDGQRFFARTIPIGGFSITQQIAKEFNISTEEADTLKKRHGFVDLGGAYEEPESEVAATISKIVRNVMTRLHGEINRSISVYRTQQKGNKPSCLYLSGGSSAMACTDTFFSEKLRMEVSYFNPFKIVKTGESMDVKQLEKVVHMMPESVGLALRSSLKCPVEISLIPETLRKSQSFATQKPFLIGSLCIWLSIFAIVFAVKTKTATLFKDTSQKKRANVERLNNIKIQINAAEDKQKKVFAQFNSIKDLLDRRYDWSNFLNALQLHKPQDVWLEEITKLKSPKTALSKSKRKSSTSNPFVRKKSGKSTAVGRDEYAWFNIVGSAIAIPSTEPSRKLYTDEQVEKFEGILSSREIQNAEIVLDAGDKAQKELENYQGFWEENEMKSDMILPEVFLESLQWNEMFSENPDETRILETNFSEKTRNLTTFKIQLRLVNPIITKR